MKMTSRERLLEAIRHKEPDMVPNNPRIAVWLIEYYGNAHYTTWLRAAQEWDFDPVFEVPLNIPDLLYSQFEQYNSFKDIEVELKIASNDDGVVRCRRIIHTPAGKLEDEMLYPPAGGIYGMSPNPEKCEYMLKDSSDLEKIKYLLPDPKLTSIPYYNRFKEDVGDNGLTQIRPAKGIDHLMVDAYGLENLMMSYYENPKLMQDIMELFSNYYSRCILRALEYSPDVIFDGWYNCSLSAGWSPEIWRKVFKPQIIKNKKLVADAGALYHFYDDGKIMGIYKELGDIAPDIFSSVCPSPTGDADLPKLKSEIGDKVTFNGFVDLQTILRGTPEDVEKEVKYAIESAAKGGGFILGTSDSIRNGSPTENVAAYFAATRKYGKYKH